MTTITTRKQRPQRHLRLLLNLTISISILISTISFLNLSPPVDPTHHHHLHQPPFLGTPKVAFLFLARAGLPLDFLWRAFFAGAADKSLFSVYIHSRPGFVFDAGTTRAEVFYGREIAPSVTVRWGEPSMIEAERLLLATALEDPANQRFVLLSESCVPLYNFSYTYHYLMSSQKSFVDSFIDEKETRYNPKMYPTIPNERWRKGSQWITLVRKHAVVVVTDNVVFPVFKRHCKRRGGSTHDGMHLLKSFFRKEHNCIPDEHYVQTLLSMRGLEHELERRTLTYTSWNKSTSKKGKQNWHPLTFEYINASPQQIKAIKSINHIDYNTEFRTEWCKSNSTSVPCFIFARKFSRGAAMRILTEGFVGSFDAASLLLRNSS